MSAYAHTHTVNAHVNAEYQHLCTQTLENQPVILDAIDIYSQTHTDLHFEVLTSTKQVINRSRQPNRDDIHTEGGGGLSFGASSL